MIQPPSQALPLDRRANVRADVHRSASFVRNPVRPIQGGMGRAITQDICLRGVRILTRTLPPERPSFPIWIHLDEQRVIRAQGSLVWTQVETMLGDSPYWLQCGLSLIVPESSDRVALARAIAEKVGTDRVTREEAETKIGYLL